MLAIVIDTTPWVHAERAQRESESRFRTLADNIAAFAWMADEAGNIYWYNKRWFDYTGLPFDEPKQWGWPLLQHPDHADRVLEKINRCLATGEVWEDTFPLKGRDGVYRWFLSRAMPIRDDARHTSSAGSAPTRTSPSTSRRPNATRSSQPSSPPRPTRIISMSSDGIIQSWNPGAERMFGYTADEVIGKVGAAPVR